MKPVLNIFRVIGMVQIRLSYMSALFFAILGCLGLPVFIIIGIISPDAGEAFWDFYRSVWPLAGISLYSVLLPYLLIMHEVQESAWSMGILQVGILAIPLFFVAYLLFRKLRSMF